MSARGAHTHTSGRTVSANATRCGRCERGAYEVHLPHLFVSPNNTIYCVAHDGDVYTHRSARVLPYARTGKHRRFTRTRVRALYGFARASARDARAEGQR